jgi:hypothetical protein
MTFSKHSLTRPQFCHDIAIQYKQMKSEENEFKKLFGQARAGNDPLQLDITETGVSFSYFLMTLLALLFFLFPHKHRHPGHCEAEDIIIFKGRDLPLGDLNVFNWLLMVL